MMSERFDRTGAIARGVQQRSGRAIALSRLVLASVFLLAIYIDPSQPSAAPERIYFLLAVYVALALAASFIAWRSWWWDHGLARPMHLVDLLLFAAVVFSTEGYTSPFFTFSLFLLLSASIRWGGRETARTAIAVNLLFLAAGTLSGSLTTVEIDVQRLLIRSTYLIVLSLLCIWFALDRDRLAQRLSLHKLLREAPERAHLPQLFCDHVAAHLAADRVICVSHDDSEPWELICERNAIGEVRIEKGSDLDSGLLAALPDDPFLFDSDTGRMLAGRAQQAHALDVPDELGDFARNRKLGPALGIPVRLDQLDCALFVCGLPLISIDDLTAGAELAEEVAFLQKQSLFKHMSEQAASDRTRLSIGRDLHDSVAQVVAGISFRLEGFKRSGKAAVELAADIEMLQGELSAEQRQLRMMIADLRRPGMAKIRLSSSAHLADLAERLGRQWNIACTFTSPSGLKITPNVERELNQIVREGVANAVRHGKANRVAIVLQAAERGILIEIIDNGWDRPSGDTFRPRSLCERAATMGGTLDARAGEEGTRVRIEFLTKEMR